MDSWTWPLVVDAFRRGHDTRVGFEDSALLPFGARAQNNAELVTTAVGLAEEVRGELTCTPLPLDSEVRAEDPGR